MDKLFLDKALNTFIPSQYLTSKGGNNFVLFIPFRGKRGDILKNNCLSSLLSLKVVLVVSVFCLIGLNGFTQNKRIISLAPSLTKNLYLLEANDKIIGCTSYCTEALEENKEVVGTAVNVNVEKVFSLQPDLVVTMHLSKQQDIDALRNLGIRVEIFPTPISFNEICQQFSKLGELVGNQSVAQRIVERENQKADSLKNLAINKNNSKNIFFQIGAKPIFSVLQNTFMDDYILFSGCKNIATSQITGTMTRETVLMNNPDVIIIATMGGIGVEEKKLWQSFKRLKATEDKKIFLIDSEYACAPTPVNFTRALEEVINYIYE